MGIIKTNPDDQNEIRIGVLGYGFMAKCHTNAFKTIPFIYPEAKIRPRLSLLCGRNEQNVVREAKRFGYEAYCTDWRDVVGADSVDVFDNCSPDPLHVEPCIEALKSGKHVICEKPLAVSVDDAKRMRDAAQQSSGKAMCTFNYRFMPAVRAAKDLIDDGKLGTIYQMRVNYLQMAGHDPADAADQLWFSKWPHSGGLQGLGSHAIDQCRFLVGEIDTVSALVRTFNQDRALPSASCPAALADEGTAALLEFKNGAIGVMESSVVATGRKNFLSWEINGSQGSLKWDLEHPNSLYASLDGSSSDTYCGFTEISVTHGQQAYVAPWWPPGHNFGWEHGHIIEKYHFLESVASGTPMSPYLATFDDGYRVALIIDAMRKSSKSGSRVELD